MRSRGGLGNRRAAAKLYRRAGQSGHRALGRVRRHRPVRSGAVVELAREQAASTWSWSGPKRRWSPGSPTRCARPAFAVFGPSAAAAQLEGSKGFTKDLCRANGIPTADYVRVERAADAHAALEPLRRAGRDQGRRARRGQGRDRRDDPRRKPRRRSTPPATGRW